MPAGRPITENIKENKDYFKEYYHKNNSDITCECGQFIKLRSLYQHKKSKKHQYIMDQKIVL